MAKDMQAAAEALEFETAARFRDRLAALSAVQSSQDINPQTVEEADVFAIDEQAGQFCIQVFFFPHLSKKLGQTGLPTRRRTGASPPAEVLDAFLAQFYDDKPAPRLILLSTSIENADLWPRHCPSAQAIKWKWQAPSAGRNAILSITRWRMRVRRSRASWPIRQASPS